MVVRSELKTVVSRPKTAGLKQKEARIFKLQMSQLPTVYGLHPTVYLVVLFYRLVVVVLVLGVVEVLLAPVCC
jgi:hypothetical protein